MRDLSEIADLSDVSALNDAVDALSSAARLLVALDFDGTLAPFVDRPGAARVLPQAGDALKRLETLPDTWIAFISGRSMSSLERVTEADKDALLVASHGVEIRFGADGESLDITAEESDRLARLGAILEPIVATDPNIRLEPKPLGFGVHTRLLSAADARRVNEAAYAAARSVSDELTIREGKDILEFSIRDANKGYGIERLREHVGATAVLFAGDDVTDEDGFAVLGPEDCGVKVGPGDTSARFRVADPEAIAALLSRLAEARASRSS
jgi:trehalose 6-phosphate phosphatase